LKLQGLPITKKLIGLKIILSNPSSNRPKTNKKIIKRIMFLYTMGRFRHDQALWTETCRQKRINSNKKTRKRKRKRKNKNLSFLTVLSLSILVPQYRVTAVK
jgi:hypothetical protein